MKIDVPVEQAVAFGSVRILEISKTRPDEKAEQNILAIIRIVLRYLIFGNLGVGFVFCLNCLAA
jgi:hypothetical protein